MTCLQKIKLIGQPGTEQPFSVGTTGRTDINTFTADFATTNWADTGGFNKCHARFGGAASWGSHTNVRFIRLNDFANQTARLGFDTAKAFTGAPAGPFSVWSARYYFNMNGMPVNDSFSGFPQHVSTLDVVNGSTKLGPLICANNIFPRTAGQYGRLTIPGAGVGFSPAGKTNIWQRCEIQFNEAFTPKMVVRLYDGDGTTPWATWSYNPTGYNTCTGLALTSTDNGETTLVFPQQVFIALLEFYNTYDLDGQYAGGTATVATTSNPSGTNNPETEHVNYTFPANMVAQTATITADRGPTQATYIYGFSPARRVTVWVPGGSPANAGGWPTVFWCHGGFFVEGDRGQIPINWVNTLLNAGYAVVSVQYCKATPTNSGYPAYGTDLGGGNGPGGGSYLTFLGDVKLAAVRVAAESVVQGWNLDSTRFFSGGFSAGGYIGMAAAVSQGVTNDGAGTARNTTIASQTAVRDGYTGADPAFIGMYGYGPPLDLQAYVDYDLSDTGLPLLAYGLAGWTDRGVIAATARSFLGLNVGAATADLTNCGIPSLVARRALVGAVPPAFVTWGTGDYLVPQGPSDSTMAAAMSAASAGYTVETTPTIHDWLPSEFEPAPLIAWLDARVSATGGTPGVAPPQFAGFPTLATMPSLPSVGYD